MTTPDPIRARLDDIQSSHYPERDGLCVNDTEPTLTSYRLTKAVLATSAPLTAEHPHAGTRRLGHGFHTTQER